MKMVEFPTLLGETLIKIDAQLEKEYIDFYTLSAKIYRMFHDQDCCENVVIDDIVGDLDDLIGSPILIAEESYNDPSESEICNREFWESETWAFYKLATIKGYVDIKWHGSSNGYYSEKAYLYLMHPMEIYK